MDKAIKDQFQEAMENRFELLVFIEAKGSWAWLGEGITSYPLDAEENQRLVHAGCLALESDGVIERAVETGTSITWRLVKSRKAKMDQ